MMVFLVLVIGIWGVIVVEMVSVSNIVGILF